MHPAWTALLVGHGLFGRIPPRALPAGRLTGHVSVTLNVRTMRGAQRAFAVVCNMRHWPATHPAWTALLVGHGLFGRVRSCDRGGVDEFDAVGVAPEVLPVECQQAPFAVRKHGGDDVRVVDLASGNRHFKA